MIGYPSVARRTFVAALVSIVFGVGVHGASIAREPASDPLPSWNDGPAKQAIVDFVERVTREGGPDYVAPSERIATFDNDGTLWAEQPTYFQFAFALDRVKALAPQNPEWTEKQPFKGILENDSKALADSGTTGLLTVIAATHAGMTTDEFGKLVTTSRDGVGTACTIICFWRHLGVSPAPSARQRAGVGEKSPTPTPTPTAGRPLSRRCPLSVKPFSRKSLSAPRFDVLVVGAGSSGTNRSRTAKVVLEQIVAQAEP